MAQTPEVTFTDRTGQEIVIRTARADDAGAALSYIQSVAEKTEFFVIESDEFPASDEEERIWIQDHVDDPGKLLLFAEANGRLIGSVSFEAGPFRRVAHRGNLGLSVAEKWRGRGVGTALLQSLVDWAESTPLIEKVCLEVFATNANAIRLYQKLGFVEEGQRIKDVKCGPDDYVDTVVMVRWVK